MKLTRSYILPIFPNFNKLEEVRYSSNRYILYLKSFVSNLFYTRVNFFSTEGMGSLANKAQKQAIGIVKAELKQDKLKFSCPTINFEMSPASIIPSKSSSFDFWVTLTSQLLNSPVRIPANSHRKLNQKLKEGWGLSKHCEFVKKDGRWKIRVFVTKEVEFPEIKEKYLGVDVGVRHSVARSDGYLGCNLLKVIEKEKKSQSERQRQHHKKKPFKTKLKQILDREVTRTLRRSEGCNIVIENPKNLSNLRPKGLSRWAKIYFSSRLQEKALEKGVFVQWVNPAYTSITCFACKKIDKKSREKQVFKCTSCGNTVHADLNAARNIALKGQERLAAKQTVKPPAKVHQSGPGLADTHINHDHDAILSLLRRL